MGLVLAFKSFFKALRNKQEAQDFLLGVKEESAPVEKSDPSHLQLLALLQKSGRLVDFLQEDISSFTDAQVGAAVRPLHGDCQKVLEEVVTIRPVLEEGEGREVVVPSGYNPHEMKVVGQVKGAPPYKGRLVHRGWRAHKRSLPKQVGSGGGEVLHPAEIEVK